MIQKLWNFNIYKILFISLRKKKLHLEKQKIIKMRSKLVIMLFLSLISNKIISQEIENVNPKGNWYFGAEIGSNNINSFSAGGNKNSFQAGVLSEYYFSRHWSLSGRIKYFKTGVSFYKPNTYSGGWINLGSEESFGNFDGAVISIPLDIKWEFRIYKNLAGNLKLGYAYNIETKSNYGNYSENLKTDYPKQYGGFNIGYGLNYFMNKKTALYLDVEFYSGGAKGYSDGFFGKNYYYTQNVLINLGIKYNFKKDQETI